MKTLHINAVTLFLMSLAIVGWTLFSIGELNIVVPLILMGFQIGWFLAIVYTKIEK